MRYGFKRVTMDDIARELSVSKKTIYQFFKDKRDLVCRVTECHFESNECQMEKLETESKDVVEFLIKATQLMRAQIGRVNPGALVDLQRHFPEGWNIFLKHKNEVILKSIANTLKRGQQEGYFRPDFDPQILAIMRMETVQAALDDRIFPGHLYDRLEVHTQIMQHFIEGILTDKGREVYNQYLNQNQGDENTK
jgi:AcrR family transcriptional regulator